MQGFPTIYKRFVGHPDSAVHTFMEEQARRSAKTRFWSQKSNIVMVHLMMNTMCSTPLKRCHIQDSRWRNVGCQV